MKSFKILNSKKVQLLILMSLVLTLTLGVYMYRGKEVVLEVDGNKTNAVSYSKTVEELLQKEEIDIQEGAYLNLPLDTEIENNLNIIIINPKTYNIIDNEEKTDAKSVYDLVGRVLTDQKIELGELDYTVPALGEKLEENAAIEIFRVKEEVIVTKSDIKYEEKKEKTDTLYIGKQKVKQKGSSGELSTHTKNRYVNGKLEKSEVIKEEVTKEKIDHIVLVGAKKKPEPKPEPKPVVKEVPKVKSATRSSVRKSTAKAPAKQAAKAPVKQAAKKPAASKAPSRGDSNRNGKTITMEATAYDLSYQSTGKRPGDKGYGITASGMQAGPGVVAVDPRVIPLGTKLYIEGYGNAIAGDTGGAIKGNIIDVFFHSPSEVKNWGRRKVKVTILK